MFQQRLNTVVWLSDAMFPVNIAAKRNLLSRDHNL